jgi:RecA-family ATPase
MKGKTFKLHTLAQVMELQNPEWLIEGVIEHGGLAMLFGPSGHGKSFLSADWMMCVTTGTRWAGREVRQGRVIYVAARWSGVQVTY